MQRSTQVAGKVVAILATLQQPAPAFEAAFQYPWMDSADHWFRAAYDAVLDGADAAQALGEAQRKALAFVDCLETRHDVAGNELARACALGIDPDYPLMPWEE